MQITTITEPSFTIDIRTAGRGNVRLDVAPVGNPTDVISMPLGRTKLSRLLSVNSTGTEYGLSVADAKGRVIPKNGRRHHVRLMPDEVDLLDDIIGELRGIARVAQRI